MNNVMNIEIDLETMFLNRDSIANGYTTRDEEMKIEPITACNDALRKLNTYSNYNNFPRMASLIKNYYDQCNTYYQLNSFYKSLSVDDLNLLGF